VNNWAWLSDRRVHITFFVLLAVVLLIHNNFISLWDQDEGAYAGFASRILATGDWLIPEFPWSKIHRKPPLHFWNIALSAKVFGMNEFSTRFPSAVFLFGTVCLMFYGTRDFLSKQEAFLSAVILSTSLFVLSLAKISVTDGTLLFFMTVCAIQVLSFMQKPSWKRVVIFWLAFAAALLVKGPPVIIFTGFFAALLFIIHPKRFSLLKFHPWVFLPVAALPLFYWGYLAWQEDNGQFITWMIDWYILKRIGGSVLGQSAPFGTHFLFILVSFSPYLFAYAMLVKQGRSIVKNRDYQWIGILIWFVAAWFPYELSPSKLPAYTVAAHVPLAILLSKTLLNARPVSTNKTMIIIQGVFSTLFVLAIPIAGTIIGLNLGFIITSSVLSIIFLILLFKGLKSLWNMAGFTRMIFYNAALICGLWIIVYPQIDAIKNSPKRMYEALLDTPETSKIIVANSKGHPPSLIFYLERIFDGIDFIEDTDKLIEAYSETSYPMVLNQDQFNELEAQLGAIDHDLVCSSFTDRKGKMCYYIVHHK